MFGVVGTILVILGLLVGLPLTGTVSAQTAAEGYIGKFTLQSPVHWGKTVLKPGSYTITIQSTRLPVIASICDSQGRAVTHVASSARSGRTDGLNALLIEEKGDGQSRVYSLALAELGMELIYGPAPVPGKTENARFSRTVPVLWARNGTHTLPDDERRVDSKKKP